MNEADVTCGGAETLGACLMLVEQARPRNFSLQPFEGNGSAPRLQEAERRIQQLVPNYVSREASETAATRMLRLFQARCEVLPEFLLSGPSRDQFGAGLRVTIVKRYALYYRPTETEISVVRVLHGARGASALAAIGDIG